MDACELAKYECLQGNAVLPGIIREVCEDLKIPGGMFPVVAFTLGEGPMEEGGKRRTSQIFLFVPLHVAFTAEQKLLGKRF